MILRIALVLATILVALTAANTLRQTIEWPTRREVSVLPLARLQDAVRRYGCCWE